MCIKKMVKLEITGDPNIFRYLYSELFIGTTKLGFYLVTKLLIITTLNLLKPTISDIFPELHFDLKKP